MQSQTHITSLSPTLDTDYPQYLTANMRLADNPHLDQLKRRHLWKKIDVRVSVSIILPWMMLYSCGLLLTIGLGFVTGFHVWLAMASVTMLLIIGVPFVISTYAGILTANDVSSGRYELMKLTNLSNRQLAWSYYYSVLWQFRAVLWIWAIFMLTTAVGVVWITALGGNHTDLFAVTMMVFSMVIQLGGLCWAMVALAVAFGIRFPQPSILAIAMPLTTLLFLISSVGFLANSYVAHFTAETLPTTLFIETAFLVAVPYMLLGSGLWLAQHWARQAQ